MVPIRSTSPAPEPQKKKKGFFSRFGKREARKAQVDGPTNFSHDVHATWDPVNGFQIDNLPPAWKDLFKRSGVKKSDLKDPKTSLFILETIAKNIQPETPPAAPTPAASSQNSSKSGGSSGGGGASSKPAANIPPPPPPPPSAKGAPPPPGPPPPAANKPQAPSMTLAEQLAAKQSTGLKHVTEEEKIEASGCLPAVQDPRHMEMVLRNAMKGRRGALDEEDDDDGWSDDE